MNFIYLLIRFSLTATFLSMVSAGILDENKMQADPNLFDMLPMDLPIEKIRTHGKVFGANYNGCKFPIVGFIMKETEEILLLPMIIVHTRKEIFSSCIVETSSSHTYLTHETLNEIGIMDALTSDGVIVALQGLPTTVYESTHDRNVCGQSFFAEHKLKITVNYRSRKILVEKTSELTLEELQEL